MYLAVLSIGSARAESAATEPGAAPSTEATKPREQPPADAQFERALPHLEAGEIAFDEKNYEAALAEFERAYELLHHHPKQCETLKNIGLCHELLFRYNRALEYYNRFISECGTEAAEREKLSQKVDILKGWLGTLKVSVNVSAEVWVDNVLIGRAPGTLLVAGGRHTLELRAKGYESEQREISIPGGSIQDLSFYLKDLGKRKGISPAFFATAAGLAVISAGIGTGFGVQALSKSNAAKDKPVAARTNKMRDDIDAAALKADVCYAIAGALALGAGIVFFMTDWSGNEATSPSDNSAVKASLLPQASAQGAALSFSGTF
jgi:tetratricopeptide (TPR) repeat protein